MITTMKQMKQLIEEAFERQSWHGPNLRGALRGIPAEEAMWRPAPGRHNIWELAVHCAYWKYAVRRRLTGGKRGSFPIEGSNWFERPSGAGGEPEWRKDRALLVAEHRELVRAVEALRPAQCDERVLRLLRGIALHDVYHAGQVQILKRLYAASD